MNISPFKSFIPIQGEGADKTLVQWGDTAQSQPLGTYGSATFAVNSAYFIAKNITFKASDKLHSNLPLSVCFTSKY